MKYVVLNEKQPAILATLYEQAEYKGESQGLPIGSYNKDQLMLGAIGSARLEPNTTFILYENADGSGKSLMINESIPDFKQPLDFVPQACVLYSHVAFYDKDGQLCRTLFIGEYPVGGLGEYDRFVVPESLTVTLRGGVEEKELPAGEHTAAEISDGTLLVMLAGVKAVDSGRELSGEELLKVVGGAEMCVTEACGGQVCASETGCMAEACGARACAANACPVQACPANACLVNVIPVVGII